MVNKVFIFLLRLYQKTISPDHGFGRGINNHWGCKFYPSCSEYAVRALSQKSTPEAIKLISKRLIKCHPFSQGGYDPI